MTIRGAKYWTLRRLRAVPVLALVAFALLCADSARSDFPGQKRKAPKFKLDYSQFRGSDGKTLLEVYYRVYNRGLEFVKTDSGYVASYEVEISIMDGDRIVDSRSKQRRLLVSDKNRTESTSDYVIDQFDFDIEPGKRKIVGLVTDLRSDADTEISFKVKLKNYKPSGKPKVSGIEILHSIMSENRGSQFSKGNITAIPMVDHELQGGPDGDPALIYFEIYPGKDTTLNALVETKIRKVTGKLVYHDTVYLMMNQEVRREVRTIDLTDFKPGDYKLKVEVTKPRNKNPYHTSETRLSVFWPIESMVRHKYDIVLRQLKYIATPQEVDALKGAKTENERMDAWKTFWELRDRTPGDGYNEAKKEFYQRVNYANHKFRTLRREGWETDRGRIFLKHGIPDETIDQPFSPTLSDSYQIWYYYHNVSVPLTFTFIDSFGDGDYRLQYPFDGRRF